MTPQFLTALVQRLRRSAGLKVGCLLLFASCVLSSSARAQEIFLKSDWLIDVDTPAASIWAGGNESSGTTNDAPHSSDGICLAESAIGQLTAQSAGYPGAETNLDNSGEAAVLAGNGYQYTSGQITPAVAWNIIFPGGFNPATGQIYPANSTSNTYIAADIAQADYEFRACLGVNPADTNAAQELVLLVEDQILPLEWSGTEAMAYSTYARLLGMEQDGTNVETIVTGEARVYFQSACDVFDAFLANPYNADLVEGQNPYVSSSVSNQVAEILDDYLRNLSEYAQASLVYFQLQSMANFYDPTVPGNTVSQTLLSNIDGAVSEIQMRLVLATPFQNLPVYTIGVIGQIKSTLHDLRRLHQSIVLGRITFNAGASGDPTGDPSLNYGEFTTAFVPFFTGLDNPGNSSFDVALGQAELFVPYAQAQESAHSNDVVAVLQRQYEWASDQNDLQNQYESQLENLCGYTLDTNGNPVPDIFFAALPPGLRESTANSVLPAGLYQLDETGTIYQQWLALETAETNLLLAEIQLTNTFAQILVDKQVADTIYSNQLRIAELVLTNGQQISAIDQEEGQVEAQADLATAQIQSTTAQQQGNNSFWNDIASAGEIVVAAVATVYTGGAATPLLIAAASNAAGQVGNAFTTAANAYDQASADLQIGSVEANEATQIADLNAQIVQINAAEQAEAQYLNADTTMLNLSAQLTSLQGQARAQEVQIQLAAQQVDQERSKLANMLSQVSSLINQWVRSAALVAQNPDFTSDLLLERDKTIQQMDDAYALAQQWAFLAALCFNYKDNCPQDETSYNFVQRVLQARRTADLIPILDQMESAETLIAAGCQSSVFYSIAQFSVRNNFFQANQTQVEGTNTVVTSYQPVLSGGTILTNAAASQAAWTNYLASSLTTNQFGQRVLVIPFSTSLDGQLVGGLQWNPLWTCDTFGTTLYSGSDNNGNELHGVQVSLVTQGFTFPLGSDAGFVVQIAQNGTSVIRNRGFGNITSSTPGFRYFNFGSYTAGLTAGANDLAGNTGTASFQDRSPANGQWRLSINANDSANNGALLNNLGQLTDIQLQFNIRSYIDQTAAQACNQ